MISLIQILSVLFGLFMLYVVSIHKKKGSLAGFESVFWTIIWLGFIYLAIFPASFIGITQRLHIARVFDLLLMIALMILTIATLFSRFTIKSIEKKLEEVVRKGALHGKSKRKSKN
jgi:hypothetical protein